MREQLFAKHVSPKLHDVKQRLAAKSAYHDSETGVHNYRLLLSEDWQFPNVDHGLQGTQPTRIKVAMNDSASLVIC